jgi:hypothetical protein
MYRVLERLQDALDGDLDGDRAAQIEADLAIARQSDRGEIVSLAIAIGDYLQAEKQGLPTAEPGYWQRIVNWVEALGRRPGRRVHRTLITGLLILWVLFVVGYIAIMFVGTNLDRQIVPWRVPLIVIQGVVGGLMIVALIAWLRKKEEFGLAFGIGGFLLSLVALQLLYFYLSQFAAITATLLQLAFLQVLLAYRRWYLSDDTGVIGSRVNG